MSTANVNPGPRDVSPAPRRSRVMRHALTMLRVLLAIQFAFAGAIKLAGTDDMVTLFADIGAGQWLRYLVGVIELACAVGLLIPSLVGVGALGLTAVMIGATFTRAVVLGGAPALEAVFAIAAAAVAYSRRAELESLGRRLRRAVGRPWRADATKGG